MSQYTDKINRIAKDFAEIEQYESTSSLLAQNGCMVITYKHGGYLITSGDNGGEYNGYELDPNEELYIESSEEYYLSLKKKYNPERKPIFKERIAKYYKKLFGIKVKSFFK